MELIKKTKRDGTITIAREMTIDDFSSIVREMGFLSEDRVKRHLNSLSEVRQVARDHWALEVEKLSRVMASAQKELDRLAAKLNAGEEM